MLQAVKAFLDSCAPGVRRQIAVLPEVRHVTQNVLRLKELRDDPRRALQTCQIHFYLNLYL